jgi:hypothetical protein
VRKAQRFEPQALADAAARRLVTSSATTRAPPHTHNTHVGPRLGPRALAQAPLAGRLYRPHLYARYLDTLSDVAHCPSLGRIAMGGANCVRILDASTQVRSPCARVMGRGPPASKARSIARQRVGVCVGPPASAASRPSVGCAYRRAFGLRSSAHRALPFSPRLRLQDYKEIKGDAVDLDANQAVEKVGWTKDGQVRAPPALRSRLAPVG